MGKGKRLVFVAVAAALMVIAMYSAGCGGESTSTTADAGKKIGDPVDATQISADCKEPQACEKAVEFHNLILEGSYLDAFDLIYYDPANSVAMDKQQRI